MDNKLSELSKPVATVDVQRGRPDGNMFGVAWSSAGHAMPDGPHFLYSQEYVSALLAELEFEKQNNAGVAGMVEDYETKLEAKDKRIAELEGSATLLTNQRDLWYGKVQDLEAKLATPVRLKKVDSSNVPYAGDGFNAAVDYCADRVRAAGFTVEGDE
ncbi:hypothetical protein [Serratia marcescens]|uniref:hypothetical protein n=1 Tax=Serratia marcescens TaxID=615 RepID=UPI000452675D|nr:hypothetical protein [Serratia marcescens]EZQ69425.1 hypothetical protein AF53_03092 [Serratia marcescens BIDMC 80]CVE58481.1 Uncharacterised protein [Serratia marcescens]